MLHEWFFYGFLESNAIAFVEESRCDIGFAGVTKTFVAPARSPAIANDEAAVGSVPNQADTVASSHSVWLEVVNRSLRLCSLIPGCIDIQRNEDGPIGREPGAPLAEVFRHIDVVGALACRSRREERILVSGVHLRLQVKWK